MKQAQVKVKKVSAYPIDADLVGKAESQKGRIVKLTNIGLLIETQKALQLGEHLSIRFVLPVHEKNIDGEVVVIKTYIRHGGEGGQSGSHHLNELHFRAMSDGQKLDVHRFLASIKTKQS